jgi:hypothetical protein
VRGENH